MKELKEIIFESQKLPRFLMPDAENAISYFNEYDLFKKTGLTKDNIEYIYDYAVKNNKPCPIVGNYGNNSGKFAFRRWVAELDGDYSAVGNKFDIYKAKSPYCGLHDTTLAEDGKFFPSSEDWESVIAISYNNLINNDVNEDDLGKIAKDVEGKLVPQNKLEQILLFYNENKEVCDSIASAIPNINSNLSKLYNLKDATQEWNKFGQWEKRGPNRIPKTDIISENGKYKISFKKYGGSQLMSGFEKESKATLRCCMNLLSEEDQQKLNIILNNDWNKISKSNMSIKNRRNSGDNEILNADITIGKMNRILNEIINENPEYKKAVMYEAASGEKKFGKDCDSCANCIFVWDDVKPERSKFYSNIEKYIEEHMNANFLISYKSAGEYSSISLRIIISK